MASNDNVTRIRDVMRSSPGARANRDGERSKIPYKPCDIPSSGFSDTLRVRYSNGDDEVIRYVYVRSILYGNERGGISLESSGGYVTLLGHNLHPLMDVLEKQRASRIDAYDPGRHEPPKDGDPIIEQIVFSPANG